MFKRINLLFVFVLLSVALNAATIETIELNSPSMGKKVKVVVVLPASLKTNQKPFPVLYLLHGFSDDQAAWTTKTSDKNLVATLADKYNIIIICPDAGYGSWYWDSPIRKDYQYETFVTKELVKHVDENYKTIKSREGRVISGLSMGGHGALYLAARSPQLYIAAGSIAGVVDASSISSEDIRKSYHDLLGNGADFEQKLKERSVINFTDKLKTSGVALIIDCGTDDFLYESNKALHRKLLEGKIPHDYTERPGAHDWEYFSNSLEYHLVFFQKTFDTVNKPAK